MKILQLSLPLAAAAAAAVATLSLSSTSVGYSKIGGSLGPAQRDFRIFNNFTAPGANENQVPDPNFPGYFGADMAIWKGCIEWGSRLHGDGNGDPHQPFDLGSGGANFDPSFQGRAPGPGSTNGNVHSQLSGCNGGVYAFTETPISDGWRIRYYECMNWQDGPGPIPMDGLDLQSVAAFTYGSALGLGPSSNPEATKWQFLGLGEIFPRSLHADDIAGLQCIYGAESLGVKPVISSLSLAGSTLTITGQNFDPSNNAVWFTEASSNGDGEPVKVLALPSTAGGTQIVVNVPAEAGPGDVLVRKAGGEPSLSNAWPFDANPCPTATNYCVGAQHSQGGGAVLGMQGSQGIGANNLILVVNDAPSNKFGIFFYGPNRIQAGFGDGFRCVGGQTQRLQPVLQTDNLGFGSYSVDLTNQPGITSGSVHNFQFWFRDPMGPGGTGFNTSDGLSVPFCN